MKIHTDLEFEEAELFQHVIESVSGRVLEQCRDIIIRRLDEKHSKAVDAALGELARQQIQDVASLPIQRTDLYGNKKGEPVQLRAFIIESFDGWFTTKVDKNGDEKGYERNYLRGNIVVRNLIEEIFKQELEKALRESIDAAKLAIKNHVAQAAAERIKEVFKF